MTRQKKEILKKIDDLRIWIAVDEELGCGFAPADAYLETYEEIDRLERELAGLRHYDGVEEMYNDARGCGSTEELPFI